jgi:hypothetical protein
MDMDIFTTAIIIFLINLPFGYWRANVNTFSLQWFLSIHLLVPFIIALRFYSGIGFELSTYPIILLAFIFGQYFGKKIFYWREQVDAKPLTSCLVMDLVRIKND